MHIDNAETTLCGGGVPMPLGEINQFLAWQAVPINWADDASEHELLDDLKLAPGWLKASGNGNAIAPPSSTLEARRTSRPG